MPTLTPIDYNPFTESAPGVPLQGARPVQSAGGPKFTPIDYNPFTESAPGVPLATPQPEERGFFDELGRGVKRGFQQRGLGVAQLANDAVNFVGDPVKRGLIHLDDAVNNAKHALTGEYSFDPSTTQKRLETLDKEGSYLFDPAVGEEMAARLAKEGKGTGVSGFVGEMLGDPISYLAGGGLAKGSKLGWQSAKELAKYGGAVGAGYGVTQPLTKDDSRLENTALSTAIGAAAFPAGEAIGRGVGAAGRKIGEMVSPVGKNFSAAENYVVRKLANEGKTTGEIADIVRKAGQAGEGGIPVTLPEAANSATLQFDQKLVTKAPGQAGDILRTFTDARATEGVPAAFDDFVRENISRNSSAMLGGKRAAEAASDVLEAAYSKRTAKSSPFYEAARADLIPEETFAQLKSHDYIAEQLSQIRADKLYASKIKDLPDNSVGVMDMVKRRIADDIKKEQGKSYDNLKRADLSLMKEARGIISAKLAEASPTYKLGVIAHKNASPQVVRMERSIAGALAKIKEKGNYDDAVKLISDGSPAQIRYARRLISLSDPEAWSNLVAAKMSSLGGNATSPQTLMTSIGKNAKTRDTIRAWLTPQQQKAFDAFSENLRIANKIQHKSDTAPNLVAEQALQEGLDSGAGKLVQLSEDIINKGFTGTARDRAVRYTMGIVNGMQGINYQKLAKIFVGEGADDFAARILKYKPGSKEAADLIKARVGAVSGQTSGRGAEAATKQMQTTAPYEPTKAAAPSASQVRGSAGTKQGVPPAAAPKAPPGQAMPGTPRPDPRLKIDIYKKQGDKDIKGGARNDRIARWEPDFEEVGRSVGVDPKALKAIVKVESAGNHLAKAKTSSAHGLFQFINSTWKEMVDKYGKQVGVRLQDRLDPRAQMIMGALFTKDNADGLRKRLGREPRPGELYMAHFMGLGGASKVLSANKAANAASLFPKQAKANRPIFFTKDGRPRTVGEVQQVIFNKVERSA